MSAITIEVVVVEPDQAWDCERCGVEPVVAYVTDGNDVDNDITIGYCKKCLGPAVVEEVTNR